MLLKLSERNMAVNSANLAAVSKLLEGTVANISHCIFHRAVTSGRAELRPPSTASWEVMVSRTHSHDRLTVLVTPCSN